jgi:hypothetical protein
MPGHPPYGPWSGSEDQQGGTNTPLLVGDNQLARPDPPHPGVPSRLSRLSRRSRLTTLFWLRVRRLSAGDDAPLSSLLMASWMDASKAAAKAAKDTDAAKEKEKLESVGRLKERSAKIPRAAGGLRKLLDKYLDETMSKTDATSRRACPRSCSRCSQRWSLSRWTSTAARRTRKKVGPRTGTGA